jgi:4-amino-4-deoxy-L-arabinose transferase-like glycosyltransferase
VLVVVLAVLLRLALWWLQARSGAVQPGDPEEYYRAALHLMQGGYHDTGKWLRPPLYPALLALLFTASGVDITRALLIQAVLSGISVPVFGLLAQRLYGRRDVALAAGAGAALFVPLASFGSVLFAEGLFVVLIVLALAQLVRAMGQGWCTPWARGHAGASALRCGVACCWGSRR